MTATEAAARLGVKRETVYAYASRGLLRSTRAPDGRSSLFDPGEVERLATRTRRGGGSRPEPFVIESGLTLIDDGRFFYRGHDAVDLAAHATFEQVAELLWDAEPAPLPWRPDSAAVALGTRAQRPLPESIFPFDRLRVILAAVAASDHLRYETSAPAVAATARGLIAGLVECLPRLGTEPGRDASLAERLWSRLCARDPEPEPL